MKNLTREELSAMVNNFKKGDFQMEDAVGKVNKPKLGSSLSRFPHLNIEEEETMENQFKVIRTVNVIGDHVVCETEETEEAIASYDSEVEHMFKVKEELVLGGRFHAVEVKIMKGKETLMSRKLHEEEEMMNDYGYDFYHTEEQAFEDMGEDRISMKAMEEFLEKEEAEKRMADRIIYEIHVGHEEVLRCECHGTPTYILKGINQLMEITEDNTHWTICVADKEDRQEMGGQYQFLKGGIQEVKGFLEFLNDWGHAFPQFSE